MPEPAQTIAENLAQIQARIADAAIRSGRTSADVTLVAVTKYVDAAAARALLNAGCTNLGESRPQELWRKAAALEELPARWHMIGHLQRNKARRTLQHLTLLHSGDSLRLLDEVNRLSADLQLSTPVLLQVNVSDEEQKHGFDVSEMEAILPQVAQYAHLEVRGLMAMARWTEDVEEARADFSRLRELRDQLRPKCPSSVSLNELSMGMSGDFEVAIEEGATVVRVGSALFEGVTS